MMVIMTIFNGIRVALKTSQLNYYLIGYVF